MKSPHIKQLLVGLAAAAGFLCLMNAPAVAGLNIYAQLTANGADVDGDTSVLNMGAMNVENHLEIHALNHELFSPQSSGQTTGRLTHAPIKFVKPVDKASPLLMKALSQNEVISGNFKFFRTHPDTGEVIHYYSIEIQNARISGVRSWMPSNLDSAANVYPFMEEVSIIYTSLVIRHELTGREHSISVQSPQ